MLKYDDIINLPHYEPKNHPRMSLYNRSAQFAPFSALTGYKEAIIETGRIVYKKKELSLDEQELINRKLKENLNKEITIIYFVPDKKKDGGEYLTIKNFIKKMDLINKEIIMMDNTKILIENILDIKI